MESWRNVTVLGILLFVGSAVPVPPRYDRDYGPSGPDKFLHLLGHAGLAAALVAAFDDVERSRWSALAAIVLSTAYGIGTELFQERIPGREFERWDVVAGFAGSVLGTTARRYLAPHRGDGPRS